MHHAGTACVVRSSSRTTDVSVHVRCPIEKTSEPDRPAFAGAFMTTRVDAPSAVLARTADGAHARNALKKRRTVRPWRETPARWLDRCSSMSRAREFFSITRHASPDPRATGYAKEPVQRKPDRSRVGLYRSRCRELVSAERGASGACSGQDSPHSRATLGVAHGSTMWCDAGRRGSTIADLLRVGDVSMGLVQAKPEARRVAVRVRMSVSSGQQCPGAS